jgi:hypothetical protein
VDSFTGERYLMLLNLFYAFALIWLRVVKQWFYSNLTEKWIPGIFEVKYFHCDCELYYYATVLFQLNSYWKSLPITTKVMSCYHKFILYKVWSSSHWNVTCSSHDIAEHLPLNNNQHIKLVLFPPLPIKSFISWSCHGNEQRYMYL